MSAAEPSDSTDSTTPGAEPVGNTTEPLPVNPYPFLNPPEQPDELGRLGGYRVLRLLGSGGMGLVFEAEEIALHRRVALKVLKPELAADSDHRQRFLREARAAAALNSDHVVTIYHVADAATPYFAMQFLEGESLQTRLEGPTPVTLRLALEIARQTADGLAAAHAKGLIHRDIKPANLWLETARAEPPANRAGSPVLRAPRVAFRRVKILDFGLVRRTTGEPSLTSTGFIVGTPNFMAPEQASGAETDGRADLFSLGCVLYTMLAGELPFPGNSALAVMMALASRTPPAVNVKNPAVPREVADLVARLLEKDPRRRPQSARELVTALDRFLADITGTVTLPTPNFAPAPVPAPSGLDTVVPGQSDTWRPAPASPAAAGAARRMSRYTWLAIAAIIALAALIGHQAFRNQPAAGPTGPEPIVVGILHSQTRTMAVSENPVIDATLLAVEELNAAGGVLGRPLKPVVADGKSDPDEFARQAERLLAEDRAVVIFGCWTSASRKAVRDVVQRRNDGLLFYPVQYEGLERSPRIVYLGPAPNQQLLPAVEFLTRPAGAGGLGKKRLYLVGSDYVFPRAAHEIIKDQVRLKEKDGVQVVGEMFIPFGSDSVTMAVADINRKNPDAIINTINGSTNVHFFRELRKELTAAAVPTLSVSITENEIRGLNPATLAGDYLAASYFQTIDRPESREFLRKLRERFPDRVGSDAAAAAYSGVHLWAKAVAKAGTTDAAAVVEACRGLEFDGPRARVKIDPTNLNAWLPVRIGKIRADGSVELVPGAGSETPIGPVLFPPTRTEVQWGQFLHGLTSAWEGKWQPPDKK
jgi:urea transport system substrate-binding protein